MGTLWPEEAGGVVGWSCVGVGVGVGVCVVVGDEADSADWTMTASGGAGRAVSEDRERNGRSERLDTEMERGRPGSGEFGGALSSLRSLHEF